MHRYNYKFSWVDKNKKFQVYFVEKDSKENAIEEFEKETKLNIKTDHVRVVRLDH